MFSTSFLKLVFVPTQVFLLLMILTNDLPLGRRYFYQAKQFSQSKPTTSPICKIFYTMGFASCLNPIIKQYVASLPHSFTIIINPHQEMPKITCSFD